MPPRLEIKREFVQISMRVKSVDLHPTEAWILASFYSGSVCIWNYQSQTMVKSFKDTESPVRSAKFIVRKQWVVAGGDDMSIRVYNYRTMDRVKEFEAHTDYIRCVSVHPTLPYLLSSSDDMQIKLWDWEKDWICTQVFVGHSHYVMQVTFNPKDTNTFASVSLDQTIKIWNVGSPDPNFTLAGHSKGINCVDYFTGGDRLYLITGSDDHTGKVWDYQTRSCVQTLVGHTDNVSAVCVHPELPIIITGSEDRTIRIWHATTYRLENTLNYGLERVWAMGYMKGSRRMVIGFDEGTIMIKIGREGPVTSMDSSGIIMSGDHNEIQTVNINTVGADYKTGVDADVYEKLKKTYSEVKNLREQVNVETVKLQQSEEEMLSVLQKFKTLESLHSKEVQQRRVIEEALEREKEQKKLLQQEMEQLKIQQEKEVNKLQSQKDKNIKRVLDLENNLATVRTQFESLQAERNRLQQERDDAVNEREQIIMKYQLTAPNLEFSHGELQHATGNFNDSNKIGEGGFGCVYKGFLRNTRVAIKILNPQSLQGQQQFKQEVSILSRVRHPNLVALIGACSEASGIVYEYLPNGCLEDRLTRDNNFPPLMWQVRTRIISEICSALIFLHSNRPHIIVHGDLKPANILLDANLVSKLSDFGISRLLTQTNTDSTALHRTAHPVGTLAYMDPEYLRTGELTSKSDVYSFGIIILRLLTGKAPLNIASAVERALTNDFFPSLIDTSAGDWPVEQAKELAYLGLRCMDRDRTKRPNLIREVWPVVESLTKTALLSLSSSLPGSAVDETSMPCNFICPIFQEVMKDPYIAADGFTYEGAAIRAWFDSGHDTSPMTNLRLPHCQLIPNLTLRSTIQEWLQQHPQS